MYTMSDWSYGFEEMNDKPTDFSNHITGWVMANGPTRSTPLRVTYTSASGAIWHDQTNSERNASLEIQREARESSIPFHVGDTSRAGNEICALARQICSVGDRVWVSSWQNGGQTEILRLCSYNEPRKQSPHRKPWLTRVQAAPYRDDDLYTPKARSFGRIPPKYGANMEFGQESCDNTTVGVRRHVRAHQ